MTKDDKDRMVFKVAQLRNVALTGPWFHDGSGGDLGDVVRTMGRIQLATELKSEVVDDIVAFLHTLNGKGLKTP